MGRPHERCSIPKARLVVNDMDYYKVPPTGELVLRHFTLAGRSVRTL